MLFDLRSRRRKNVVRVIYLGLAALMIVGLVLFGVGTGASGLLNNGNGGGGSNGTTNTQVKKAEAAVKQHPNSASAWGSLYEAQMINAQSGTNVTGTSGEPTRSGVKALKAAAVSWQKYLALTNQKPSLVLAEYAGKMYTTLALTNTSGAWNDATDSWQYAIQATPASQPGSLITPYECAALTGYAGKQTQNATLAAARAEQLAKKIHESVADTAQLKEALVGAKKATKTAAEGALATCSTLQA
jgi:hypothetical protein